MGGLALGKFVIGPLRQDPQALEFFSKLWHGMLLPPKNIPNSRYAPPKQKKRRRLPPLYASENVYGVAANAASVFRRPDPVASVSQQTCPSKGTVRQPAGIGVAVDWRILSA
jgi:hypothetical protein